jgi:hypothetical protein
MLCCRGEDRSSSRRSFWDFASRTPCERTEGVVGELSLVLGVVGVIGGVISPGRGAGVEVESVLLRPSETGKGESV